MKKIISALLLVACGFPLTAPAEQGRGKPCHCEGQTAPGAKTYGCDSPGRKCDYSFRCQYTCYDRDGVGFAVSGLHERKTMRDPGDKNLRCSGLYYRMTGENVSDIGNPFLTPEPRAEPTVQKFIGFRYSYIDADEVQQWAKENGCPSVK